MIDFVSAIKALEAAAVTHEKMAQGFRDSIALLRARQAEQPSGDDAPPSSSSTAAPQGGSTVTAANSPKERKPFAELPLSQQAGMRCSDSQFEAFMYERYPSTVESRSVAGAVRYLCNVTSRAQLDLGGLPAEDWNIIEAEFQRWLTTRAHADTYR